MPSRFTTQDNIKGNMEIWREKVEEKLREALEYVAKHTVDSMEQLKTGEHYSKYPNPSSAPGEYPAVQFGYLAEAIENEDNHVVYWENQAKAHAMIVIESPPEGDILDDGLRPWRNRAWIETQDKIEEIMGPKLIQSLNEGNLGSRARRRTD